MECEQCSAVSILGWLSVNKHDPVLSLEMFANVNGPDTEGDV